MNDRYNLYNLEASFKDFLHAGKVLPVTLKNYLSDFRHFLGWIMFYLKAHRIDVGVGRDQPEKWTGRDLSLQINANLINDYKSYLIENKIPIRTINRRLSTIRKFCSFCISQGWMKENPAKKVGNVIASEQGKRSNLKKEIATVAEFIPPKAGLPRDDILQQFHQDLLKENLDKKTITSYLDDVQEFLLSIAN